MSPKYQLSLFLIASLAFAACKKDDDTNNNTIQPTEYPSAYLPLYQGNYWIYESWVVDSNGFGAAGLPGGQPPAYDSVYVIADTTIGTNTYHRYRMPLEVGSKNYNTYTVRDSGNYLVDVGGFIVLALYDSTSVFLSRSFQQPQFSDDSVVNVIYKRRADQFYTTPDGNYKTIPMSYQWAFIPYSSQMRAVSHRRQATRYARYVGMTAQTMPFFVGDPMYVERRLIRKRVLYPIE